MDFHNIDDYFHENSPTHGGEGVALAGASAEAILERVDHDITFLSEKLLNLEMLVMEIARQATDMEPLMRGPRSVSAESVDKAFEFDVLHSIIDSEANELEKLAGAIQLDIGDAETKALGEEQGSAVTGKLRTRKESLKQMQEVVSAIRRQLATFEKVIQLSHVQQGNSKGMGYENGHMSSHAAMQAEDQINVLQMLQHSIASKLDLENKLCNSQSLVEDLKMKLHFAEEEPCFLEESIEEVYERMFSAENASQLFLGASKELVGKLSTIQFYLSASVRREDDLKSKLEESLMKLSANRSTREILLGDSDNNASQEPAQMQMLSPPEFLTLWNTVQQLEELLRESSLSRGATEEEQNTTQSEIRTFGNIITDLKLAISNAESRTQNAEIRCTQLTQTHVQLNRELNSLKSQGSDRAGLLETKLKESDTQLEHARASVDAIVEQQGMLRSSMSDMEQVIEDLKEKYLKAETRAESAESKCSLLTDTNLELSEELSFLRGRVESLENSLHEANQLKVSTAKDIASKTKTIMDLVAKFAMERERLHVQIVTLTKKNRVLVKKCTENVSECALLCKNVATTEGELRPSKVTEEEAPCSTEEEAPCSSQQTKVKRAGNTPQEEVEADEVIPVEESGAGSTLDTVRSIEPTMLNWKYIFAAFLASLVVVLLYQLLPM